MKLRIHLLHFLKMCLFKLEWLYFSCPRCRRGQMSLQLNWKNLYLNPGHPNLPSPIRTTPSPGMPLPLGPVLHTSPPVASRLHYDLTPKARPLPPALLRARQLQPLTLLPSAQLHLRYPRGLSPRTRGERDSPRRIIQNLWSQVRISMYNVIISMQAYVIHYKQHE